MPRSFNRAQLNASLNRLRSAQRQLEQTHRKLVHELDQHRYWIACPCGYGDTLSYRPSCCPRCGRRVAYS